MLNFGGFLSSNFWTSYRCQSSASIEDLLNSKNCTVEKLLDDDDCLQELKNFNEKLIKYFDHDKLKTLIDYITVMPTEEDGHDRGHKYPFIAGEIFNCEINQILDKFFEAPVKPAKEDDEEDDKDDDETTPGEDDTKKSDENKAKDLAAEEVKDEEAKDESQTEKKEGAEGQAQEPEAEEQQTDKPADQAATKEPEAEDENKTNKEAQPAAEASQNDSTQATLNTEGAQETQEDE